MTDVTFQHWAWMAGQPEFWWAVIRHLAALGLFVWGGFWLWARKVRVGLAVWAIAGAGLIASYVWALGRVRQVFVTGIAPTGVDQLAVQFLRSFNLFETGAVVLLLFLALRHAAQSVKASNKTPTP